MKLIIAGGRSYVFTVQDEVRIYTINTIISPITEIVIGCAAGADRGGKWYAREHNLKIKKFPANWKIYGNKAGPIRNRLMAQYADAVALFPGGRGTQSMYNEAKKAGIQIFDFRG